MKIFGKNVTPGKVKIAFDVVFYFYGKIAATVTLLGVVRLSGYSWKLIAILGITLVPVLAFMVFGYMKYVYPSEAIEYQKRQIILVEVRDLVKALANIKKEDANI